MFHLRELTLARSRNSCGTGGGDGVPLGIFPRNDQGLERVGAALTCRQGDFAEDLSEEGMRRKRQGQVDKQMSPLAGCIHKKHPDARVRLNARCSNG